ncbi:MAG TPA: hypothetical protein VFP37_10320 [Steroidobacteraceae bacterium]|nr:hypothetical protein [Steroidobacteraceae bacterium]
MRNPSIWRGILIAVLGIGIAVAIAAGAWQAGVAHALAASGQAVTGEPGVGPHAWGHWHGFFFAPFFFLLLLLLFARVLFWRRPWHGGCHHHDGRVPPAFEEWHRRAHEQSGSTGQ